MNKFFLLCVTYSSISAMVLEHQPSFTADEYKCFVAVQQIRAGLKKMKEIVPEVFDETTFSEADTFIMQETDQGLLLNKRKRRSDTGYTIITPFGEFCLLFGRNAHALQKVFEPLHITFLNQPQNIIARQCGTGNNIPTIETNQIIHSVGRHQFLPAQLKYKQVRSYDQTCTLIATMRKKYEEDKQNDKIPSDLLVYQLKLSLRLWLLPH